jgi:flavin reductase (DIM6/NTAB) family NADH-FMN oxidoreductase RutF
MLSSNIRQLQTRYSVRHAEEPNESSFRETAHRLPSGVSVVTFRLGEERAGLTATSVSSLSDDPPRVLVSVRCDAAVAPPLVRPGAFAVNVLAADQRELAERFAAGANFRESTPFQGWRWLPLPSGTCCLADTAVVLDCDVDESLERHGHAIMIGRVRRVLPGRGAGALISWRGGYDQVGWTNDEISRAIGLSPSEQS